MGSERPNMEREKMTKGTSPFRFESTRMSAARQRPEYDASQSIERFWRHGPRGERVRRYVASWLACEKRRAK